MGPCPLPWCLLFLNPLLLDVLCWPVGAAARPFLSFQQPTPAGRCRELRWDSRKSGAGTGAAGMFAGGPLHPMVLCLGGKDLPDPPCALRPSPQRALGSLCPALALHGAPWSQGQCSGQNPQGPPPPALCHQGPGSRMLRSGRPWGVWDERGRHTPGRLGPCWAGRGWPPFLPVLPPWGRCSLTHFTWQDSGTVPALGLPYLRCTGRAPSHSLGGVASRDPYLLVRKLRTSKPLPLLDPASKTASSTTPRPPCPGCSAPPGSLDGGTFAWAGSE